MKPVLVLLSLFAVLCGATKAFACPTCEDVKEQVDGAYIATVWILSLLPITLAGSLGYFLVRRGRSLDAQAPSFPAE